MVTARMSQCHTAGLTFSSLSRHSKVITGIKITRNQDHILKFPIPILIRIYRTPLINNMSADSQCLVAINIAVMISVKAIKKHSKDKSFLRGPLLRVSSILFSFMVRGCTTKDLSLLLEA